ncbi:neutral/alkaline non-lysosomal ceramidase C-terminal domain-containing protein, partial [Nocardia cyriacigeorgica]|uniref:neutral/alkaline non-lysosomal ceramidase C-terminal domain-containing protein n=1 Tax=Nocardia cyriacigeorgica TaxID=135487 RepID=UPI002455F3B7
SNLGEQLGKLYVDKHFPPEAKERAMEMVDDLFAAYRENFTNSTFLEVQRRSSSGRWERVANEGEWAVRFHWRSPGPGFPAGAPPRGARGGPPAGAPPASVSVFAGSQSAVISRAP